LSRIIGKSGVPYGDKRWFHASAKKKFSFHKNQNYAAPNV
jgi:hypothetical protein